jgi:hypothetical protein
MKIKLVEKTAKENGESASKHISEVSNVKNKLLLLSSRQQQTNV